MSKVSLTIRKAEVNDYMAIAKISREDLGYACEDELVKKKISVLDYKRECVFVAEVDNAVVGYVHVERYDTLYMETIANILGLAVMAEKRCLGAGHQLMSAAEDWARSIGAVAVRVNSSSHRTKAHEFYRNIGYNTEKQQIRFFKTL